MYCNSKSCSQVQRLPSQSKYFKEELISEILTIPPQKPEIERILDILVWPEVVNVKLVETDIGRSNEGQNLSGVKLVIELNLKEKVTYVACDPTQSVHALHFESLRSIFVVVPPQIDGKDICSLVRADKIPINPYIEINKFRLLDCESIHHCILLFLDIKIC